MKYSKGRSSLPLCSELIPLLLGSGMTPRGERRPTGPTTAAGTHSVFTVFQAGLVQRSAKVGAPGLVNFMWVHLVISLLQDAWRIQGCTDLTWDCSSPSEIANCRMQDKISQPVVMTEWQSFHLMYSTEIGSPLNPPSIHPAVERL